MKIGFLIDDSLDRPDGVQQYVLGLGKYYEKHGHKVFYLTSETKRKDIKNLYSLSKAIKVRFNGNVLRTPLPANNKQLVEVLNKIKLDVLHVQMPYSPLLAGKIIKLIPPNTAVVGTLHIFPNSWVEEKLGRFLNSVNRRTLARIDKVIAVSLPAQQTSGLSKSFNIKVIPNHINLSNYKNATKNDDSNRIVIFLGRLVKRKGCQQLLEAIKLLNHQGRLANDVKVHIAGDGPQKHKLEKFVKQNKLHKVVSFTGYLSEAQKPNFLSQGTVAVFPSSGGESFGIVLLEAMSTGCSVLAGNNPGYASVIGKNSSQLFDPNDISGLAFKIERLLSSRKLREQVNIKQQNLINKFDINLIAQEIELIYKEALHTRLSV